MNEAMNTRNAQLLAMLGITAGWWLVTVAMGEPNETLSVLCAICAVLWVGAVMVLARRG